MHTKVSEIERNIERLIDSGALSIGDQIPSLLSVKEENHVSRDTVIRAYKNLVSRGVINAIRGKGYFVSNQNTSIKRNVFLLLDELSDYKNTLVKSIETHLGDKAQFRIFFHHYDEEVFRNLIEQSLGNFTQYIISPFPRSIVVKEVLKEIPDDKLILIDRRDEQDQSYKYVGQEYKKDIVTCLDQLKSELYKYNTLNFIFPEPSFHPEELKEGFRFFCEVNQIEFNIYSKKENRSIQKGEAYLVIDDNDLARVVEEARNNRMELGKDIGLISYNETRLKSIIDKGITTISTDFLRMGENLVHLIFNPKEQQQIHNPVRLIKRKSF